MANPGSTATVMDRDFLTIRSRLIDVAAALDRIDRAQDDSSTDPRKVQIRRAIEHLLSNVPNRTERIQLEFSLPEE